MATPLKICLIEDHDDVRRELAVLLRAHGHTVSIFSDAESFKEKMPTCDVYIIDLGLPGEDGLSLSHWLRKQRREAHIFILTAYDQNDKRIESYRIGVELFLTKPIDPAQLIEALDVACAPRDDQAIEEAIFSLDLSKRIFQGADLSVKLSYAEAMLLKKLVDMRYLPLSQREVAETLNVGQDQLNTGTVEARVSILRKKLAQTGADKNIIAAVRKFGYKLAHKVTVIE